MLCSLLKLKREWYSGENPEPLKHNFCSPPLWGRVQLPPDLCWVRSKHFMAFYASSSFTWSGLFASVLVWLWIQTVDPNSVKANHCPVDWSELWVCALPAMSSSCSGQPWDGLCPVDLASWNYLICQFLHCGMLAEHHWNKVFLHGSFKLDG